jgi:hypothetical protein
MTFNHKTPPYQREFVQFKQQSPEWFLKRRKPFYIFVAIFLLLLLLWLLSGAYIVWPG